MLVEITQEEAIDIIQEYLKLHNVKLNGDVFIDTAQTGEMLFCFGTPLSSICREGKKNAK